MIGDEQRQPYPLPQGWAWTAVGSIAETSSGGTPRRDQPRYFGGSVPWVKSGELGDGYVYEAQERITEDGLRSSSARLFPKGTLCIALYGATVGKLGILGIDAATNQAVCGIALHPGVDVRFMFRALEWKRRSLIELGKGGAQSNISQEIVRKTLLPLPPTAEQLRIVAEVDKQFTRLDAAVEALKRVRAKLKRYRASLLTAACEGRLVPTEADLARAEGRDYEPADVLLQRILKKRRAEWEADQLARLKAQRRPRKDDKWKEKYRDPPAADSRALPDLPEGWVWARWEQAGLSQNGQSFPSKEYQATGIRLLRPGNLHPSGRVSWTPENTRRLPEKWATDVPRFIVRARELVINLTAQSLRDEFLGRVCITQTDERCLLNQRIARLTPIEVAPEYLLWMFKSEVFRRFVNGLNTGSLIQHMFTSQLADFCLPLPPLAEQGRIVAEVERRLSLVGDIEWLVEANLKRAERLRQSILKFAFEGKLVPQDPNDEPASVLLERIRAERATKVERAASREGGNRRKRKRA
jgi:type I restriction enzyme S subunit